MIGKLKGVIDSVGDGHVILDVAGVGYVVFLSNRTLEKLPPVGGSAGLYIETHVREDHIHLYGFASAEEKEWFTILTGVQGVGAKMALAILSSFGPDELLQAIHAKDAKLLTRANGVGPKLAERLVTELKSKAGKIGVATASFAATGPVGKPLPVSEEAVSALVNLGYGRSEAYAAVSLAGQKGGETIETLIPLALKELAK